MSKTFSRKPLAIALGTAMALAGGVAQASVFQASDLGAGYMVAADTTATTTTTTTTTDAAKHGSNCDAKAGVDQKTGECMCGANKGKMADGKCGEGKCGEGKKK
jgi:uncharacterized low-complexity protein